MGLFSFGKKESELPPLRFFNTLSGTQEVFEPLTPGEVKMYNCGPTVYDRQHLGNMFSVVFANTLRRTLEHWGYNVNQVINITDFGHLQGGDVGDDTTEDKMTQGLMREGLDLTLENMRILAERYIETYMVDIQALGVDTSTVTFPRASDYIPEQIALITTLVEKGYAYELSDGVYFDTEKFVGYGKLGHINLAGQQEGARVNVQSQKRSPQDFVLWKKDQKLGWESPWGMGFPGWHIECTAMIFKLLGKQIDIHTGGIEHIPIHHNNEIAQAEAATGKQFVRTWMHNNHITIENKKISKSLGNTVYLSQLIDRGLSPRAYRYWVLTGHYRTPMNFTWDSIEGADQALKRLTKYFFEETAFTGEAPDEKFMKDFREALADDLNTARAMARVWELIKDDAVAIGVKHASLLEVDKVFGLGFTDTRPTSKLKVKTEDAPEEVQGLLQKRIDARAAKDFARSDELRGQIEALGYTLTDTPDGQKLERK